MVITCDCCGREFSRNKDDAWGCPYCGFNMDVRSVLPHSPKVGEYDWRIDIDGGVRRREIVKAKPEPRKELE